MGGSCVERNSQKIGLRRDALKNSIWVGKPAKGQWPEMSLGKIGAQKGSSPQKNSAEKGNHYPGGEPLQVENGRRETCRGVAGTG